MSTSSPIATRMFMVAQPFWNRLEKPSRRSPSVGTPRPLTRDEIGLMISLAVSGLKSTEKLRPQSARYHTSLGQSPFPNFGASPLSDYQTEKLYLIRLLSVLCQSARFLLHDCRVQAKE